MMFNARSKFPQPTSVQSLGTTSKARQKAYVKIIEQPAPKAQRFRYVCEGRSAGSIPGISSTPENKTFPTIQVVGYKGKAVVVVSCVTKDEPYRPHPHNLVGKEGCKQGICKLDIPTETMSIEFKNLGIQCVKKKDIEAALRLREEIRVDPFKTGFSHKNQPIDLSSVRLCFQVFLKGDKRGEPVVPLSPVISDPIYDKKTACDLVIVHLTHCVCPADGDSPEIVLLCEKIAKEDIEIRFYEEQDGVSVWEDYGKFQPAQVHKQVAIRFKPPRYPNLEITEVKRVNLQLRRPSDGATSESVPFEFLPVVHRKRKRPKFDYLEYMLGSDSPFVKMEPRVNPFQWTQETAAGIPTNPNPFNSAPNAHPLMTWNFPFLPNIQPGPSEPAGQNLLDNNGHRLFNLHTQNTDLTPINIHSGELGPEVAQLSDTFKTNISLSDIQIDQNMTDSLTRLANDTIESMMKDK